jgi:hypothetical protein
MCASSGPSAGAAASSSEPGLRAVQMEIDYRRGLEREELAERQPTSEVTTQDPVNNAE